MPSGSFFPVGDNVVTVEVTDIHGNKQQCSFHVIVNCVTPTFTTCPSNQSVSTDLGLCSAVVNYTAAAAGDPLANLSYTFAGATTGSGTGTGTGAVFNKGVTTVTITATNICGSNTCSFTITVNDTESPKIFGTPLLPVTSVNTPGLCSAVVTWTA